MPGGMPLEGEDDLPDLDPMPQRGAAAEVPATSEEDESEDDENEDEDVTVGRFFIPGWLENAECVFLAYAHTRREKSTEQVLGRWQSCG
jgi:hypothetical protein